ncbi:MAG: glutamine amidotransferase, partial [Hyphomicrobiales bacterium]
MTTIVTILTPGYADWETALLNAAARSYYNVKTLFASPDGQEIVSSGGLRVTPDLAVGEIDVNAVDAVVVNGGSIWSTPYAPDISDVLQRARTAGKTVGGICDGTLALARAGLLDDVPHTSNGPESLPDTGYMGVPLYRDQPQAVLADGIVTAPGTAPVTFMGAVMESLGLRNGDLDFY